MNDPTLNNQLKNQYNIKIIGRDLQYREAILEITEINIVDILILKENIPGNIDIEELLKKIKEKNKNIKIIIILEKEKENIEKLKYKYNLKIYYKNKINIKKLIEIIINKKEIKNNYSNIITVDGEGEKQKLNLAYIIAKTIKINNKKNKYNKNYKILIINYKLRKKDIPDIINEKIKEEKNLINKIEDNLYIINDFNLIFNFQKNNKKLFQNIFSHFKNNFNLILINIEKNKKINLYNKNLIKNSKINYFILNPKIQEIKKIKNKVKNKKIKIIINKKYKINKKIINKIIKKKVLKINLEEIKINKKQICQEIFYIRYKKIIM